MKVLLKGQLFVVNLQLQLSKAKKISSYSTLLLMGVISFSAQAEIKLSGEMVQGALIVGKTQVQ